MHIMDETEYERLLGAAIRFESFRPRSEQEIRYFCQKTLKRHHTTAPIVIQKVLDRLTEYGYVDDLKFVGWWVGQRSSFKPKGKRAVLLELRAKGIPKEVIEAFFSSQHETPDEQTLARKAVERKAVLWNTLPMNVKKKKLYDFLMRRGFDMEVISGVVDDITGKE